MEANEGVYIQSQISSSYPVYLAIDNTLTNRHSRRKATVTWNSYDNLSAKDDTKGEKKIEITSTKIKQSENAPLHLPRFYAESMKQKVQHLY